MKNPPHTLDEHRVVAWTSVDTRNQHTRRTEHVVGGETFRDVKGLAICWVEREGRAVLLRCTNRWRVMTDTWHATIEDAKIQAEHEFNGLSWTESSA